jgi:hypothetical protein
MTKVIRLTPILQTVSTSSRCEIASPSYDECRVCVVLIRHMQNFNFIAARTGRTLVWSLMMSLDNDDDP